jgi:surface antigen
MTCAFPPDMALRACVVALSLAACTVPVQAQNLYGLMKDGPGEKFNDEDIRLFNQAADKALNEAKAGETVRWENAATQNRGELKVLKTFTWKESPCRQVRMHNETRDRKATHSLNMCRLQDKWRMVSPSELKKG